MYLCVLWVRTWVRGWVRGCVCVCDLERIEREMKRERESFVDTSIKHGSWLVNDVLIVY